MPDRFDLSSAADLESSLQHVMTYCRMVNPVRITAVQREQLLVSRTWLEVHQEIVDGWLAGTLSGIDGSVETVPDLVEDPAGTPELLASFAELVRLVMPATLQLSRRQDAKNLTTRSGKVAALDIARHVVRIACVPTIDQGWP